MVVSYSFKAYANIYGLFFSHHLSNFPVIISFHFIGANEPMIDLSINLLFFFVKLLNLFLAKFKLSSIVNIIQQ